jgi:N-acetylmuramoyl-L-alanine amidase
MIVAIFSACSKKDETNDPIIIDQIKYNSKNNSYVDMKDTAENNIQHSDSPNNGILTTKAESTVVMEEITENSDQNNPVITTKKIIAIDAGHQSKGNYKLEPIGPGSKTKKPKVSSGTQGKFTGVAEYELNLVIAKKVKAELIDRGYEVFMIRDTHDVNLSNKERAEMANESGAEIFIRIHADGSTNSNVNGVSTLYPSKKNLYVSSLSKESHTLSDFIVDSICKSTGAKNRGAIARDDMSGINWCTLPVTIIEMGYMSNKKEDKLMQTVKYQNKIVKGICDGIDIYYE